MTLPSTVEFCQHVFWQFGRIVKPSFEKRREQKPRFDRISAEHLKQADDPAVPASANASSKVFAIVVWIQGNSAYYPIRQLSGNGQRKHSPDGLAHEGDIMQVQFRYELAH